MTKSELKSMVRQLMVEILAEGLPIAHAGSHAVTEGAQSRPRNANGGEAARAHQARLQRIAEQDALDRAKRGQIPHQAKQLASSLTKDPVMQSIFASTAATTLVEQQGAEEGFVPAGGDAMAIAAAQLSPAQLQQALGGGEHSWSQLAFGSGRPGAQNEMLDDEGDPYAPVDKLKVKIDG